MVLDEASNSVMLLLNPNKNSDEVNGFFCQKDVKLNNSFNRDEDIPKEKIIFTEFYA